MTNDVIERRRAVEERLRRARTLAHSLEEATAKLADLAGQPIDQLDPTSSLRTALSALGGVAALRPDFDVILALPGAGFAFRVQHLDHDVEIEVLQRDGPDEAAEPNSEPDLEPGRQNGPDRSKDKPAPEDPGRPAADVDGDVAFDLASMLWQNIGGSS